MSEMPKIPGLMKRYNAYSYRVAVPKDIRATYGRAEVVVALGTGDRGKAAGKAKIQAAAFVRLFDEHRKQRPPAPLDAVGALIEPSTVVDAAELALLSTRLAKGFSVVVVHRDAADRAALFTKASANTDEFYAGKFRPTPTTDYFHAVVCDPEVYPTLADVLGFCWWHWHGERVTALRTAISGGDITPHLIEVDKALAVENVGGANEAQRAVLAKAFMKAEIDALTSIRAGDDLRYQAAEATQASAPAPTKAKADKDNPKLSSATKLWHAEKSKSAWSPRRADMCARTLKLFIEVISDKPISTYTKSDVRDFKEVMAALPPNYNKIKPVRDLAPRAAVKKAAALGMAPMSIVNVNKLLTVVGSCFSWLQSNYDVITANPAEKSTITVRANAREERDPFTLDELNAMFNAPTYTGSESAYKWRENGDNIPRDTARFWLPLLGLYTGARLNELCTLRVTDVRLSGGVTYLDINDEPHIDPKILTSLKTIASARLIPVHADLVGIGFLAFVEQLRAEKAARLFPELKPDSYGSLADGFGKHFARFLKSLDIKHDKNDFHSFRHTWTDACRNSKIESDVIYALKGESLKGTLSRYGHGKTEIEILAEATAKLTFRGLDLKHLVLAAVR